MDTTTTRLAGLDADQRGIDDGRPALVLLHGLTFDRTVWGPALAELAALDPARRVLALDLPGHGRSAARPSYRLDEVVEHLHDAIEDAGLGAPVLVGHSISAVLAGIYATHYPASGVVNVDQSLVVGPFSRLVQSLAPQLAGEGFDELWRRVFWRNMGVHLLSLPAEALLRRSSRPRRELVLGYWLDALETPPTELEASALGVLEVLRMRGTSYLVVAGSELEPTYRRWLARQLPQAGVAVLPQSGHFPHVAHPRAFAELLLGFDGSSAQAAAVFATTA